MAQFWREEKPLNRPVNSTEPAAAPETPSTVPEGRTHARSDRTPAGLAAAVAGGEAQWPYTWGRVFRALDFPFDLIYKLGVTQTIVLGQEHLVNLPNRLILAGVHHGFADVPLIQKGLAKSPARRLASRIVITAAADGVGFAKAWSAAVGILGFGLYPLERGERREASLRGLEKLVARGNAALIFPQGIHATPEQERANDPAVRFRPGVSFLARALDAAVTPFGLAGSERLIPPDASAYHGLKIAGIPVKINRGPLAIAFAPPLRLGADESPRAFAERLQAVCYALSRQAEAAIAGGWPDP